MRKLSFWAKAHPSLARVLIVGSYIILNILGIITGRLLSQLSVTLPVDFFTYTCIVCIVAVIFYPRKKDKSSFASFYVRQKSCDLLLISCTFLMIVFSGNRFSTLTSVYPGSVAAVTSFVNPSDSSRSYKTISEFKASLKDANGKKLKWKERKKLLKEQKRAIKKAEDLSPAAKVLLTFLSVIVAGGLLFLIAGLACNISCGGSEALAILVVVGGLTVVVWLFVLAMRGIHGRRKKIKLRPAPATG